MASTQQQGSRDSSLSSKNHACSDGLNNADADAAGVDAAAAAVGCVSNLPPTAILSSTPTKKTTKKKKKQSPPIKLPPPANGKKYTDIEVTNLMVTYTKKDVIQAIDNSNYSPKRTQLFEVLKRTTFDNKTIEVLLTGYELDSAEWNDRVSRIAQLIDKSDKQIRDIIGVRLIQCTDLTNESATSTTNSNESTEDTNIAQSHNSRPTLTSISFASSTSISPSHSHQHSFSSEKRTHSQITSDSASEASPIHFRPAPSNADNLKRAVVAFKNAVESNGVSKELVDQYAAIGEIIRSASDNNVRQQHQQMHANPKRRKVTSNRHERVSDAIASIVPRFTGDTRGEWKQSDKSVVKSTICSDAQDIRSLLAALTQCDANRASKAIIHLLSQTDNEVLKEKVVEAFRQEDAPSAELSGLILSGIREAIAHHTNEKGGTRKNASETFVKNIVVACLWNIVDKNDNDPVPKDAIYNLIGATHRQISHAKDTIKTLIAKKAEISPLERKQRKDFIQDELALLLYDWILRNDHVARLDTKQTLVDFFDPRTKTEEKLHQRIWRITRKEDQWKDFCKSDEYKTFQQKNPGATVGYTTFHSVLSSMNVRKFVRNPLPESCVDEKTSEMENLMRSMLVLMRQPNVKEKLKDVGVGTHGLTYDEAIETLAKAGSYQFVEKLTCGKVEQRDLQLFPDKECPKLMPLKCTHGVDGDKTKKCPCCGFRKRLGPLCEVIKNDEEIANKVVEVTVWEDAPRQGQKNGKQNTQREPTKKLIPVKELLTRFEKQAGICIPHVAEIFWIKHIQDIDFDRLQEDTILIFTDFAASMCLRANQAKNSSVDAHAVCDNFVVIWNKRRSKVKEKKTSDDGSEYVQEEEIDNWTVDVHHIFRNSIDSGKKADHVMHNTSLNQGILPEYVLRLKLLGIELKNVIIWTDNAPHQYRCRHTFIQVASVESRFPGVKITHRLAVVDNFKGNHDAVGKEPSRLIARLEVEEKARVATGLDVFDCCMKELEVKSTRWCQYEKDCDPRLKHKGKFGMNSRKVWFAAESEEIRNAILAKRPDFKGRILVCDSENVPDTVFQKAIDGTTHLHEVRSLATSVPEMVEATVQTHQPVSAKRKEERPEVRGMTREWKVAVCNLPCACKKCNEDADNSQCSFLPWRNKRVVTMREHVKKFEEDDEE